MYFGHKRKNGYKPDYKIGDIYDCYICNGGKIKKREKFRDILKDYFDLVIEKMIYENYEYHLPFGLGNYSIIKYKKKLKLDENGNLPKRGYLINWGETNKLWMEMYPDKTPEQIKKIEHKPLIRYNNLHTNKYTYTFNWDKLTAVAKNKQYYHFRITPKHKDRLAKALFEEPEKVNCFMTI